MRIDLYTKAVLTIIAACLVYLALGGPSVLSVARAEPETTRVVITGWVDATGTVQQLPQTRGERKINPLPVDTFQR